jgi:hypothetical protein
MERGWLAAGVPPPFRLVLLRRAAVLWLVIRLGIVVVGTLAQVPIRELVFPTPGAAGFLVLLTAWLTMFDARRRGEALFLADLGVPPRALLAAALLPPLLSEAAMGLAGAL